MRTITVVYETNDKIEIEVHERAFRRLLSLPFWLVIVEEKDGQRLVTRYNRRKVVFFTVERKRQ
jgi:hypothetical protein